MTTIATDGYTVAADSRVSSENGALLGTTEKIFRHNGEVIGCAGSLDEALAYRKWIMSNKEDEEPDINWENSFCAIHVTRGRCYYIGYRNQSRIRVKTPFAIGSGKYYAIGAMLAGKSPEQAVRIASKVDMHTGGKIRSLTLGN